MSTHSKKVIFNNYLVKFSLTLSFLSCRAYGKHGMTAVTRQAEAILQALIMMHSSINMSFTSPHPL